MRDSPVSPSAAQTKCYFSEYLDFGISGFRNTGPSPCECACVSLAFYLSPLNNVTYKHIGPAETNNPRGNTHFWTDEQTRFMLNQLLLLLVVVKRSSGNGCITTSCNENSATYRYGYDMLWPMIRFIHCHVYWDNSTYPRKKA